MPSRSHQHEHHQNPPHQPADQPIQVGTTSLKGAHRVRREAARKRPIPPQKIVIAPAAPLPGMRMAARMWPADVGSAWLCETVQKIDAGALTFGCPPVASRTRVSVSQLTFRGSAGGMRALFAV